jgi:condensin-2 complex subunit H2
MSSEFVDPDSSASTEGRFAHLLQPIRDLATNWHIDIARELEEYLSELETIAISFDNGTGVLQQLNFAEAALVIQGSACIYSKKVEYLYSLLYQTLNVLIEKKRKKGANPLPSSIDDEGKDNDYTGFDSDEPKLMDLDDLLKESKNIDIDESVDPNEPYAKFNYKLARQSTLIHRQPLSILGNTGVSGSGEMKTESKESSLPSNSDHKASDFRVSNCLVHSSGALLLEEGHSKLINSKFQHTKAGNSPQSALAFGSPHTVLAEQQEQLQAKRLSLANAGNNEENHAVSELQFDSAAAENGADEWMEDENQPDNRLDWANAVNSSENSENRHDLEEKGGKPKKGVRFAEELCEFKVIEPLPSDLLDYNAINDPWLLLDPHDNSCAEPKPFKKSKSHRNFEDLRGNSSILSGPLTVASVAAILSSNVHAPAQEFLLKSISKQNLRVPYWPEFAQQFIAKINHRKVAALGRRKAQEASEKKKLLENLRAKAAGQPINQENYPNYDTALETEENIGEVGSAHNELFENNGFNVLGEDNLAISSAEQLNSWDNLAESAGEPSENLETLNLTEELATIHRNYEDLCREHVEIYIREAEKYINSNEITQKVAEWQSKLQPILEEQQNRSNFDIIHTGKQLVSSLQSQLEQNEAQEIDFQSAVQGCPRYQVCRMFLAALQLANNGNLELKHGEEQQNSLQLKLINPEVSEISINTGNSAENVSATSSFSPQRGLSAALTEITHSSSNNAGQQNSEEESVQKKSKKRMQKVGEAAAGVENEPPSVIRRSARARVQ